MTKQNAIHEPQTTLIRNALIINEDTRQTSDVLIQNGRIERIATSITPPVGAEEFDAQGQFLLPGMIDDQVHFREPGLDRKGNLATESAAAVIGGITSFMEMPNTQPPTTIRQELAAKYERARGRCSANYAFYFGASNDNIEEIRALKPNEAAGIKIFMGASTGNMLVDNEETLELIFRDAPCLIATHCEDTPRIQENILAAKAKYGTQIPPSAHPEIRDTEACYRSSSLAVELARRHAAKLHVLHLTTAKEMALFQAGPIEDKLITAEACVHHLHYCADDYERLGNQIKCNPAIKSADDRATLIKALSEDILDIIATDHAPHLWAEKSSSDYMQAAAGLPLVQHALPMALELVSNGHLTLEQIVRKTSHNVAARYQVKDRGYIREGYWADLVVVENADWSVTKDQLQYLCGWSPLVGERFQHRVRSTWVNGFNVWNDGQLTPHRPGIELTFDRRAR